MTEYKNVLDKGFIGLIDHMGDDSAIVQAARTSYGNGTKTTREDRGLIRYLMRNHHWTPFEMVEIKFHVKLPIFVARQWIRHRTANVNEYSARYSIMDNGSFIPSEDRICSQDLINKQGSGSKLDCETQTLAVSKIIETTEQSHKTYQSLIGMGVSREIARTVLPVSDYTQFYWKSNLRNIFNFINLRMDETHAQPEIVEYAKAMAEFVKQICPMAYEAFEDYSLFGVSLSKQEIELIKRHIDINAIKDHNLSKTEYAEFIKKIS